MKVIYDDATQSLIDFVQGRINDLITSMEPKIVGAISMCQYEKQRILNPHYHPLYDNPEYKTLYKQLTDIYSTAVPKYLISADEYENLIGKLVNP